MKIGTKDPNKVPKELDIALDLEYSGGCHMAIQVDLVFNKSVYLAVKLASLRGRARLELSRHPLTHWSLAFYEVDVCTIQILPPPQSPLCAIGRLGEENRKKACGGRWVGEREEERLLTFPLSIVHCMLTISQLLLSLSEYPAGVSVEEREANSSYMKGRVIEKM